MNILSNLHECIEYSRKDKNLKETGKWKYGDTLSTKYNPLIFMLNFDLIINKVFKCVTYANH